MTAVDPHLTLLDDARQAAAVADRSGRRVHAAAEDADATFAGSLEALAEAGATVVLETTVGRRLRGRVRAVSARHVHVVGDHGEAYVRIDAVTVLRARTSIRAGGGERAARPDVPMPVLLGPLVEQRGEVDVLLDGGSRVRGTTVAVGRDVLTLRNEATADRCLVQLDRVAVLLLHTR